LIIEVRKRWAIRIDFHGRFRAGKYIHTWRAAMLRRRRRRRRRIGDNSLEEKGKSMHLQCVSAWHGIAWAGSNPIRPIPRERVADRTAEAETG
jgi:hypothetical protein